MLAILLGAIGFYVGVEVEKGSGSTSTAAGTGARAAAAATGRGGGFAARLGGGAGGTFGTVSAINGKSLYVTDATGNTVKVTFNAATKVTKSVPVAKNAIRPGDAIVVQGVKGSHGNLAATSVSDTGARAGSTSTSSSSRNSASSAVNSLFGGGG